VRPSGQCADEDKYQNNDQYRTHLFLPFLLLLFFEVFYSEDLIPFGVLVVLYHATAAGSPRTRRCMIRRSHYFPKTFLT
jgi:hypothetical protein